jgi:glycosyltransferase involved in cell wall biosynthesis
MPTRKRIISVISYPFLPATTGGEICTAGLLAELSKKHEVTAFTVEPYKSGYEHQTGNTEMVYAMPFKPSRYYNFGLITKLKKLIKQKQTDWLLFEQPWFGWLIWVLRFTTKNKIAIRSHNIEYLRFKSMGKWFWQMLYIYEKLTYKAAHLVFFLSETDRQKAIYEFDLNPEQTLLTPYGVSNTSIPERASAEAIQQLKKELGIQANEYLILFFSTLSYAPNYDAVGFIADEIYPRLKQQQINFKLVICGKGLPEHVAQKLSDKPEIRYQGFVDDINLYIDAADVMLNPILSGGGVKTKAIDTLARNQRVISTKNGALGIDANVCGDNLIVVDDYNWDAFANAVVQHLNQPKHLPEAFYQTYSWGNIVTNLVSKLL